MNSRHPRKTEPQDTRYGLLVDYKDIEPHLIHGELLTAIFPSRMLAV